MKNKISLNELLRWRLARAGAEAPLAPGAKQLLELSRPWWQTRPNRFRAATMHLSRIQAATEHAIGETRQSVGSYPVATLILRSAAQLATSARILYVSVSQGRMYLHFQLEAATEVRQEEFEVTFIAEATQEPLFFAFAGRSSADNYCLDAELPCAVINEWEGLQVSGKMPFTLILCPLANGV